MKVNIISTERKWIIGKIIDELKSRLDYVDVDADGDDYDINYYITYHSFKEKSNKIDVVFLTHMEELNDMQKVFLNASKNSNYSVSMSKKYYDYLKRKGVKNIYHISPGVDVELFEPKVILGYIGRFYKYTNRKGKDLLDKVSKLDYVEIRTTEGKIEEKDMPSFYRDLDYVIVPSKVEGGPMCLLEGLACGIPIIAPKDVGMVAEFKKGIYHYKNSDFNSLKILLKKLYKEKLELCKQVEHLTWDRFAKEHDKLFKKILQNGIKSKN